MPKLSNPIALLTLLLLLASALSISAADRQRPALRSPQILTRVILRPDLPRDPRYYAYIELWRAPELRREEAIVWDSGAETTMVRVGADEEYVLLPALLTCGGTAGLVRVSGWDPQFDGSPRHWSTGWWVDQTPFDIPPTCEPLK